MKNACDLNASAPDHLLLAHQASLPLMPCPVCARNLRIAADLLGQKVMCSHCGCRFVARPDGGRRIRPGEAEASDGLLKRAERLLRLLADR
jgi:hypothetical protein